MKYVDESKLSGDPNYDLYHNVEFLDHHLGRLDQQRITLVFEIIVKKGSINVSSQEEVISICKAFNIGRSKLEKFFNILLDMECCQLSWEGINLFIEPDLHNLANSKADLEDLEICAEGQEYIQKYFHKEAAA